MSSYEGNNPYNQNKQGNDLSFEQDIHGRDSVAKTILLEKRSLHERTSSLLRCGSTMIYLMTVILYIFTSVLLHGGMSPRLTAAFLIILAVVGFILSMKIWRADKKAEDMERIILRNYSEPFCTEERLWSDRLVEANQLAYPNSYFRVLKLAEPALWVIILLLVSRLV